MTRENSSALRRDTTSEQEAQAGTGTGDHQVRTRTTEGEGRMAGTGTGGRAGRSRLRRRAGGGAGGGVDRGEEWFTVAQPPQPPQHPLRGHARSDDIVGCKFCGASVGLHTIGSYWAVRDGLYWKMVRHDCSVTGARVLRISPARLTPADESLASWLSDTGRCEALDGCRVDPDGSCEHGFPSWLVYVGLAKSRG